VTSSPGQFQLPPGVSGHPRLKWFLCALLVRLLVRLRVEQRQKLLRPSAGPCVIACRHLSWIDPIVIIATLGPNRPVAFLAAREHIERRAALRRMLLWLGGIILVERGSNRQRDVLRAADAVLRSGVSLALFPEGKINKVHETGQVLLPLEPGAAVIARRAGVPILPMSLSGSTELHFRRRVVLVIGDPISPGATRQDDPAITDQLYKTLLALTPPTPPMSRWQPGRWLARLA
jgi:1-acyl-sn-glycerol-3-phosphate acyltransferase